MRGQEGDGERRGDRKKKTEERNSKVPQSEIPSDSERQMAALLSH